MTYKLLSMIGAVGTMLLASSCVAPVGYGGVGYGGGGVVSNYSASVGLGVLPYGYQTLRIGSVPYYYHNNYWYTQRGGRYFRTGAPKGYANHFRNNRVSYNNNRYNNRYSNTRNSYSGSSRNVRRSNANYRNTVVNTSRGNFRNNSNRNFSNRVNRSSGSNGFNRSNRSGGSNRRSQ